MPNVRIFGKLMVNIFSKAARELPKLKRPATLVWREWRAVAADCTIHRGIVLLLASLAVCSENNCRPRLPPVQVSMAAADWSIRFLAGMPNACHRTSG